MPLFLTFVPSKMGRSVSGRKVTEHSFKHDVLGRSHHGFCRGKSCHTGPLCTDFGRSFFYSLKSDERVVIKG